MKASNLYYFFKLCRPLNLVIIGLTMYLMRKNVVSLFIDTYQSDQLVPKLIVTQFDFFLLVFSTILIAGAGYIINDYFDIRIDRINKPDKVIVGKYIKKRMAMLTHTGMNIIAVGIGLYLSLKYNSWLPLFFHIITTSLLWWYSVMLKRKFLIGNVVIAILSGMVPLLVGWFELPALQNEFFPLIHETNSMNVFQFSWLIVLGFSIMAAVTTLIREIQKDMADVKGDEMQNCKTMPIVLGIEKTKYIVNVLILGSIVCILIIQQLVFPSTTQSIITLSFICLPLIISAMLTHYGNNRERFLLASNFMKIAMFGALIFTFLILA